ncbi:hypothetical protein M9458_041216 [Cirrhinus mrigala]|uniref:Uncharacterized protein n=1 Tax=Cirrhinus mrigala TaxID=683832 RepID=A0ABD0NKB8_CIRMR
MFCQGKTFWALHMGSAKYQQRNCLAGVVLEDFEASACVVADKETSADVIAGGSGDSAGVISEGFEVSAGVVDKETSAGAVAEDNGDGASVILEGFEASAGVVADEEPVQVLLQEVVERVQVSF